MDELDGALELVARCRLGMHRDDVGAGFQKPRKLVERVADHQMDVERQLRDLLQLLDHRNAHGEVRHEMPVHDVDVHIARPALFDDADVARQVHEVRRQDGRSDFHRLEHVGPLPFRNRLHAGILTHVGCLDSPPTGSSTYISGSQKSRSRTTADFPRASWKPCISR